MNTDILKGQWLESKGRLKEVWGLLTDNGLGELGGKSEKLLGLLQKKYGYIREKAEPEYQDTVELAKIVSRIREVRTEKKDIMAIAFIARYGQPLLAKKPSSQVTGEERMHRYVSDRYFDSRLSRRNTYLVSQ